ncbi:VOC family protein [Carnobacterium viridans]|uniref:Catechol 2,3-dioxygenase n=1 Tax=Carnobacterium viridans TaxID=174587 RepID=A0A1H0YQ10_9LACT|nr:VOC family protein [Carnobacterium viridans]UDE95007.1 VOC family protein [Carnobacterium viridans]SDQ17274.1 Catechol 2,3-dioxygenase [Carnobacterium viridans]
MIKGIHHISAFTKSARENHFFYTSVLGLRFVKNTVNQENTAVRHLFYGDYQGNPGTLLTFFELKNVGSAYPENNYFSTVALKIPKGMLTYWESRLARYSIETTLDQNEPILFFKDPDSFELSLIEVDDVILPENATKHSDVPPANQIIGIFESFLKVERPEETLSFLFDYLGLSLSNQRQRVQLDHQDVFTSVTSSRKTNLSRMGRGSIDHIAYTVHSSKELEEMYQKAVRMEIPIDQYVERGYFKSLYVKEPNGLRIELATETPGFILDEPFDTLGTTLALPAFLENKRAEIEAQLEDF